MTGHADQMRSTVYPTWNGPQWTLTKRAIEALHGREKFAAKQDMKLIAASEGCARVSMHATSEMLNGYQTIHGGMIFSLADTAFAYACNSRNVAMVAAQASIIFLTPVRAGEILIADAREHCAAGRSGAYLVEVATEDGRPVASFQGLARAVGGPVIQENDIG